MPLVMPKYLEVNGYDGFVNTVDEIIRKSLSTEGVITYIGVIGRQYSDAYVVKIVIPEFNQVLEYSYDMGFIYDLDETSTYALVYNIVRPAYDTVMMLWEEKYPKPKKAGFWSKLKRAVSRG